MRTSSAICARASRRGLAAAGGSMLAAALFALPALAQYGADGPKPGEYRPPVPAAPRPVAPRPVPPPSAAPLPAAQPPGPAAVAPAAEDPLVAATGDRMLPPQLRGLRDGLPPEPLQVARRAGLRPRSSRPADLRNTGTPPSAAEFGALLAPPR
jgi:hypothetical protein